MTNNADTGYVPRFRQAYRDHVIGTMIEHFGYTNPMQVPRVDKVVINMGVGEAVNDSRRLRAAVEDLTLIAAQRPVVCKARVSVANFKLRQGVGIGCKVTLRRQRMYEFLDRLITIALPRVRDFRGLNAKSFDGGGNFSMGLKEHIVFTEIDYDKVDKIFGMDITICTTAKTDDEARELLRALNFPFRDQGTH